MFGEEWYQSKSKSKELALGWLYNNDIKDDFAKGYTKNLTDYWVIEFAVFFNKQFEDDTITGLLRKAYNDGFSKLLVFKQGGWPVGDQFVHAFRKFYESNPDAKFIGHVLDHEDSYYRIHPQTFFIDLNWWASVGFPEWGEQQQDSPFETLEPIRSEENHHDGYTPHWIAPGKKLRTYAGKREGWNIIKSLLEDGQKILSWDKDCRITKYYAYAEVEEDAPRKRGSLLENMPTDIFFIANTESVQEEMLSNLMKHKNVNKFEKIVVPASGLSTLIFAFKLKLSPGDKIVVYDCAKSGIQLTKHIIENYKGNKYSDFANKMMEDNPHIDYRAQHQLKYADDVVDDLNKQGFQEWITNILPTLEIQYVLIDLLNEFKYDEFSNLVAGDDKITYLHLSNIFHYMPTSFYYSLKQRWQLCNELLLELKDKSNKNVLLYVARGPNVDFPLMTWIDDADIIEFEDVTKLSEMRLLKWNK